MIGLHSLVWTLSHADWSLCCPVSTGHLRNPSPTASSGFLFPTPSRVPLPTSGHVDIAGSGLCLVSRHKRQRDCLLGGPPTECYNSKSPQVSRSLFRILAVLKNAVVWMVFTRPPISKFSSPFNNPLKHQSRLVWLSPSCSIVFSNP